MTTMAEVLDACGDWTTIPELESRLSIPSGHRAHSKIRSMCRSYAMTGRMESRWTEHGTEYRAVPGARPSLAGGPMQTACYEALDGEMDTRRVAELAGVSVQRACAAMGRLRRRGLVEAVRTRPVAVWRRASPETASETPSETASLEDREMDDERRRSGP